MSLKNEPCMIRTFFIDFNHVELKYYPFMISLDTFSGICNSADELSAKMCVPIQTKDVNNQVFSMITSRNEVKTMVKHISCD